jgi:diguanylate cyclase (GGDEF)-like protein/PAS domain S-box-containing protein
MDIDLEVIFNSEVVGVMILCNRTVVRCSRSIEQMLGYEPGELDGKSSRVWYQSDEEFEKRGRDVYSDLKEFNRHNQEMLFKRKDGTSIWGRASGSASNREKPLDGSVWLFEDISIRKAVEDDLRAAHAELEQRVALRTEELKLANEKLKEEIYIRVETEKRIWQMANHDFLTGLPNRGLLTDRLRLALVQANRDVYKVGVMFMDLDHFKHVNDTFGHQTGDELLCLVAGKLRRAIREDDTVARLGGDEFVIVLNRINTRADAEVVARKIIDSLISPMTINNKEIKTSTSIGISMYPDDSIEPSDLLKKADTAMYRAKATGRNNYQFFTPELNSIDNEIERRLD